MAGKKKKEKKKKKDTDPGLSHIASTLVPSSIFAAVPRTPTSLSQSWPRAGVRTPSPLALAVGEAGNIGRVVLGNFSRPASRTEENEDGANESGTPVPYLTTNVGDRRRKARGSTNGHSNGDQGEGGEGIEYEEPGYEAVKTRDGEYDKATIFHHMSAEGRPRLDSPKVSRSGETRGENEGTSGDRFYHVPDKPEAPIYAKVDKSKKVSQAQKNLQKDEGQEFEDLSLSEYSSSDELTDVTSRHVASDDDDTSSVKLGTKRPLDSSTPARRKSKKERSGSVPTEEVTEGKKGKFSSKLHLGESKKKKSIKKGSREESDEPGKDSTDGDWFKRKSKKKKLPEQALLEKDTAAPTVPQTGPQQLNTLTGPPQNTASASESIVPPDPDDLAGSPTEDSALNDRQRKALREVERLGFEGVSKKLGLDDLSEDDDHRYSPPAVPRNTIDFHGQTQFEREQFQDTLVEDYAEALNEQEMTEMNASQLSNAEPIVSVDKKLSIEGSLRNWETEKYKKAKHLLPEDAMGDMDMSGGEVVRNSKWVEAHGETVMKPASPGSVRAKAALWNQAASKLEQAKDLHRQPGRLPKFEPVKEKSDDLGLRDTKEKRQTQSSDKSMTPGTDTTDATFRHLQKDFENSPQVQDDIGSTDTCIGMVKPLSSQSGHQTGIHDLHIAIPRSLGKGTTSFSTSELHGDSGIKSWKEISFEEQDLIHAEPGYVPPFRTKQSRAFYHSEPSLHSQSAYREDGWRPGFSVTEESLLEQQKQLEKLIQQQQQVFETQLEEKEQQQQQREELMQQQRKLQEQLKLIEHLQRERQLGSVSRSAETVTSDSEAVFQKELIQQQQEILQHQQEIQREYQAQQERVLKHQEKLYDQIMILESQQKQIQTNIGHLSPQEKDLAEIHDREQRIVDLLNEQRQQQLQYEELSKLQQQRLEEQASFMEERKNLEQQQEALRGKVNEQENITRQLEHQLEVLRREAASVVRELADKSVQAERTDNSQSADRYEQEKIHSKKTERFNRSKVRGFEADSDIDVEETRHHRHRDSKSRKSKSRKNEKERNEVPDMRSKSRDRMDLAQYLASGRLEVLESEKGAMMELNSSLQEENRALKQLVVSLQKGGSGSSLVFQQQVKEQQQEIKVLRNTIHRLNVELSRFQAKYRPVKFEEVEGLSLPDSQEAAPWLINTKYLAPLFLAYDDRLKEKEKLLKTYDEELNAFRARVMEVVRENQQLHLSQSKGSSSNVDADEWRQLQEQAKLVVEENAVLMEHQDLLDRKTKELQRSHAHEASKLSKKFSVLESEKRRLQTELEDVTRAHTSLSRKYDSLLKDNESRIPLTDHMNMVDECRRLLEDVKEKTKAEQDDASAMLEAIKTEKQSLATKLADSEARNTQMLRELEAYLKTLKKTERKVVLLQRQLEALQHREQMAQETLSEVLKVAEKTAAERDGMVELAKSQNLEHRKAATIIKKGDQSIRGLEEKLAEYKSKASQKVASVNGRLREKEKEINKLKEEHDKELNSLRDLIREKQHQLELVMGQSRRVDEKLELVWREADLDNRRMKNTVRGKGGAMFDSDSDPNPHQSSDGADK